MQWWVWVLIIVGVIVGLYYMVSLIVGAIVLKKTVKHVDRVIEHTNGALARDPFDDPFFKRRTPESPKRMPFYP
jgi:hypothetical protein